ncbi:MAG: SagB/ThcOx family dehydrogenase [Deltaproteobacteria bacterium]|uniref:SagB/ThcOx family dehydrogenase n=1 Tax=Candidatus Zymogenus saltonus TaxID=2844893 RepID=A0A9D8KF89_9DELT|nr:SagB/ThcOx family dehydrogenase [Candidatus Zymogenus saltonus]
MGIGKKFQDETKYFPDRIPGGFYGLDERPEPFKTYPDAERIALPLPKTGGGMPIWDAINLRRSERDYGGEPVTKDELSQLIWAAQGITAVEYGYRFRAAPSAGALYPIETYLGIKNVPGIPRGLYHYALREDELELIKGGDLSRELADGALGQEMVESADVVFLFTAIFMRSTIKYSERGYRYVYLDCGHIMQNLLLAVTALGLSACPIAALYDQEVNDIIGIDGERESVLYMASVGRGR